MLQDSDPDNLSIMSFKQTGDMGQIVPMILLLNMSPEPSFPVENIRWAEQHVYTGWAPD